MQATSVKHLGLERPVAVAEHAVVVEDVDGDGNADLVTACGQWSAPRRCNAFVARMTSCGCFVTWSTYLGGFSDESGRSVAVEAGGRVYLTLWTTSPNFPLGAPPNALAEGCVALLDPGIAGSGQVVYSTMLGGNGTDYPAPLALDAAGNPVVSGVTDSTDYPTTANAYQSSSSGVQDGFLTILAPDLGSLVYSSYFGGNNYENVASLSFGPAGEIALAEWTDSTNMPTTATAWL